MQADGALAGSLLRRGAGLQMPPVQQQQQPEPALTAGAAEPPNQPNGDGTATPPGASAPSPGSAGVPRAGMQARRGRLVSAREQGC